MDPYQRLAAGVLEQAVDDLKKTKSKIEKCEKRIEKMKSKGTDYSMELYTLVKWKALKSELMQFFESEWAEGLCDLVGLSHEAVTDAIRAKGVCT